MNETLTRRIARYPWTLIALLWVASFLNAADRSVLVATMPQIRDEFGLSPTQLALVNTVFFWVYAFAAFVSGRIGDATRRSRVIAYGMMFWSVATGAMSLASGFAVLLAVRAAVALGESTYYPSATALIGDWHGDATRSRALSLHQTGLFAGAGVGALAAGLIADRLGWRAPFLVFAACGIVWGVLLVRVLRDSSDAAVTAKATGGEDPFRVLLRTPAALILCGVFFLANGASTGVMVWAPTFAHDLLGLDLTGSALLGSATINLAGFLSVPIGGVMADLLRRRFALGRFHTLAIGLSIAGLCLLPLVLAKTTTAIAVVLIASSVGKGLFDGCIYAAMHDIMPPPARATAVGAMTTFGFIGAGLSPLLVAGVAGRFGLAAGMTSLAIAYFCAVAVILAMHGPVRRAIAVRDTS